ncbi:Ciliary BBSome complex subunit 2 C-terminal [Carpediemonas membranifera]|uniref:Ciliary BBSome complex subunit 2 C-terminal n=1 Tax=Carpediemonas membranifera TaxID=201153 RepID=A0A8J6B8Z9_9EUKA|nr:Ciliary BBSome complex subunit 2 C-terminal [Carpediemonas membranifera]|eukprot:KAG9395252.1 Ciliary BBSome complex subunit 2 C-terminal [Carpediemonas membranifera]
MTEQEPICSYTINLKHSIKLKRGAVSIGKYFGKTPSLAAVDGTTVILHDPFATGNPVSSLVIPQACSRVCPMRCGDHDILFLASESAIIGYDAQDNKQMFSTAVSEGCMAMATTQAGDSVMVGGAYILQGFQASGDQFMWTVASDEVVDVCTLPGSAPMTLVAAADRTIKLYRDIDMTADIQLTSPIIALDPRADGGFIAAMGGGTVSLFPPGSEDPIWTIPVVGRVAAVASFDIFANGVSHVIVGRDSGLLTAHHPDSGEVAGSWMVKANAGKLVDLIVSNYRKSGIELLVCFECATVIGLPTQESKAEVSEEKELAELLAAQRLLQTSIASLTESRSTTDGRSKLAELTGSVPVKVTLTHTPTLAVRVEATVAGTDVAMVSITGLGSPVLHSPRKPARVVAVPIKPEKRAVEVTVESVVVPTGLGAGVAVNSKLKLPELATLTLRGGRRRVETLYGSMRGPSVTFPLSLAVQDLADLIRSMVIDPKIVDETYSREQVTVFGFDVGDETILIEAHGSKLVFKLSAFVPSLLEVIAAISRYRAIGDPVIHLDTTVSDRISGMISEIKEMQMRRSQLVAEATEGANNLKAVSVLAEDAIQTKDYDNIANRFFEVRAEQRNMVASHGVRVGHHGLLLERLKGVNALMQAVVQVYAAERRPDVSLRLRTALGQVDGKKFVATVQGL